MGNTIQSLERGLKILDIIGKSDRPLLLNEIAKSFSLDRTSVFRLVSTLVKNKYVIQAPDTKMYSLGYRVLELSGAVSNFSYVERLIRPIMQRIIKLTKQNTHLAVLDGNEVLFLAIEQPNEPVSLNISVGTREPAMVTALGRSLLAFEEPEKLNRKLTGATFKRYTKKSIRSATALKKKLVEVRSELLAFDNEEYHMGIMCFAAPVFDHHKQVKYSIGISGLREAIEPNIKKYGELIKEAGKEASMLLGYTSE